MSTTEHPTRTVDGIRHATSTFHPATAGMRFGVDFAFAPLRAELIAAGKLRPQDGFVSRSPSLADRRPVLPIAGAPQWDDYAWFRFFEEFGDLSDDSEGASPGVSHGGAL